MKTIFSLVGETDFEDTWYLFFQTDEGRLGGAQEVRNERALFVYNRVQNKITGRDFNPEVVLSVATQVEKLIEQATALENLCRCFSGWCAFW